jgi:hypothetical protein
MRAYRFPLALCGWGFCMYSLTRPPADFTFTWIGLAICLVALALPND